MYGIRSLLCASMVFLAIPLTSCARDDGKSASAFSEYAPFQLEDRRSFSNYQTVVSSYLRSQSRDRATQACVIGLTRGREDTDAVWIIWRGGDRLVRWFAGENDINLSSRNLSLTQDVVPTDADVGTSTYQVSQTWVRELENLCASHGRIVRTGS
jgi:hypothetical protein